MSQTSYKPVSMDPALSESTPARRRPAVLAGGLVAVLAVAGAIWSVTHTGGASKGKPNGSVPVMATTAVTKPMPVQISTFGRVQSIASVAVRTRIDGVIASVPVREGQDVKVGDVLFTLDDRQAKTQLKQAQGNLARDRAQLEKARRDVDRLVPLEAKSFVSKQQIDLARSTADGLEGSVVADEAMVDSAKVQLTYTVITAPIAGRVGSVSSKLGNNIRAQDATPLVTINQLRPIYVSLSVPQNDLPGLQDALRNGTVPIRISLPGQAGEAETGEITFVENAVDTMTNTVGIKATAPNETYRLWPGQFVEVLITLKVDPTAIVVPVEAVQAGPNGTFVFVIGADDTVTMKPVDVSRNIGSESVITKGIASGDRVVTSGQMALEPGAKVRVKNVEAGAKEGKS